MKFKSVLLIFIVLLCCNIAQRRTFIDEILRKIARFGNITIDGESYPDYLNITGELNSTTEKTTVDPQLHYMPKQDPKSIKMMRLYNCYKMKTCHRAGGMVCGFHYLEHYLARFEDKCTLYKVNCERGGAFGIEDMSLCGWTKEYYTWEENPETSTELQTTQQVIVVLPAERKIYGPSEGFAYKISQKFLNVIKSVYSLL